jgi:hypothetical protein
VKTWLAKLAQQSDPAIEPGLITGAQIMNMPACWDEAAVAQWLTQLDDPSQWVRGCAAKRLGDCVGCLDEDHKSK